ncbi:protein SUPPRESSOR OF npr1-1, CONSTITUTIVE 1-like isoform X2 [Punica granatum]|uniref:Protein SUPPRESSOR OF npr1-1, CONSTITUTIVE 1-like isoform X2 n=1 Tax=Punica granatum TaxID=22663 RepID=A0A6P8CDB9_PUNGR|nr:protein SUPPRESSOR OF npr1-1, CONSTITUTIVE 1-like isoform X2 [Punica granatum]
MHDQLKDLGREIVRKENYGQPGKRSRLWYYEEAKDVLDNSEGTENVLAFHLDFRVGFEDCHFTGEQFRKLSELRFLHLHCDALEGNFDGCLSNLRWLSLHSSILMNQMPMPANLNLKNIVVLELTSCDVRDGWDSIQMAVKLKDLSLRQCHYFTRTPDFSRFTNLESLSFENCHQLEVIASSIGRLKSLAFLNLSFCHNIRELPHQVGYLKALTELIIDGTSLQDIPILSHLKKLKILHAKQCKFLYQIPNSIDLGTSLSDLILDFSEIIELPDSIQALVKLQRLSLKSCSLLTALPDSIGQLKELIELNLSLTRRITKLPDSIGDLEKLQVLNIGHSGIRRLSTNLGNMRKLMVLDASFCVEMEGELPSELGQLSLLRVLRLDDAGIRSLPLSIRNLDHLQTLNVIGCHDLHTLPELPTGLTNLQVTCKSPVPIPNLPDLINLKQLTFSECFNLAEMTPGIAKLSKLEFLQFLRTGISSLPEEIGALSQLKVLSIVNCWKLRSLPTLPAGLQELCVVGCNLFHALPDLSNLQNLSELQLRECSLMEIRGLGRLAFLTRLTVRSRRIANLDALERVEALTYLEVSYCRNLERLPDLSNLKLLNEIKANECKRLDEVEGLDDLCSLRNLEIRNCTSLETLPDLSSLKLLERLDAGGCEKLHGLEGLDELESLQALNLRHCKAITRLPNVSGLKSLQWLDISGCDNLTEIPGLEEINPISISRY